MATCHTVSCSMCATSYVLEMRKKNPQLALLKALETSRSQSDFREVQQCTALHTCRKRKTERNRKTSLFVPTARSEVAGRSLSHLFPISFPRGGKIEFPRAEYRSLFSSLSLYRFSFFYLSFFSSFRFPYCGEAIFSNARSSVKVCSAPCVVSERSIQFQRKSLLLP